MGQLSPPTPRYKEKLRMREGEKSRNLIKENMLRVINDRSGLSARNQRKVIEDHNGELIMSEEKYPIEKGLAVPSSVTNQRRWDDLPFEKMEMGDSFVVDELETRKDEMSLRGRATRENNLDTDKFFSVVKNQEKENSFRVFRVK